jgi:hypothetical protein
MLEKLTIQQEDQAQLAQQLKVQQELLSERLPEIKDRSGSDLGTAIYEEFHAAMFPVADWKEFHSTSFETTTVAAAIRIVQTFSEAILEDLNKGNVKEVDFVQPKSFTLMDSFLQLGPLKEEAYVKKEATYRSNTYRIGGCADKTVRINDTQLDLMSLEDKIMTMCFLKDGPRNKATAQALSQIHGFTENMNRFILPRLGKCVESFCGILTNGLQWIFLHMRWVDGQYLTEHTVPICVLTKNGDNYEFNLGSVKIVAELILQSLSVAEEVHRQYQRALASSYSHPRLDVINENMPPRGDGDAGDDKGGCEKKPKSRRNRKNNNAKSSSQNLSSADSHGGKTVRSFGDHLKLNDLNLRLHSTEKMKIFTC